eukprot:IDg12753t1
MFRQSTSTPLMVWLELRKRHSPVCGARATGSNCHCGADGCAWMSGSSSSDVSSSCGGGGRRQARSGQTREVSACGGRVAVERALFCGGTYLQHEQPVRGTRIKRRKGSHVRVEGGAAGAEAVEQT